MQVQQVNDTSCCSFQRNKKFFILALESGNAEEGLKKAKGALKFVQRRSKTEFPQKKLLLGSLHGSIGNALLYRGELDEALEHHQEELDLAEQW